jgi:hypothetical protein
MRFMLTIESIAADFSGRGFFRTHYLYYSCLIFAECKLVADCKTDATHNGRLCGDSPPTE